MNLSFPCVAATIVKSTITAMKPHGGRQLVLIRQKRPESYGLKPPLDYSTTADLLTSD